MTEKTYFVLIGKRREGKPAEVPREKISRVVEDYPSKVLAEVTVSQHQELLRQGHKVEDLSSRIKIRVGTLAIDPTIPEEQEEAVGTAEEEKAIETEYFFVQFIGPVKPEWLEDLSTANLAPLSYYHDFTYLVHGKTDDLDRVASKPFVRTTMPYGKGLKLDEESRQLEEEGEGDEEFWILIFSAGGKVDETIDVIKSMGAEIVGERQASGFSERVRANVPISTISKITSLPNIYRIEKYHPRVDEDEVADQIVAGNYNALGQVLPPAPGTHPYLDWLNQVGVDGTNVTIGIVEASHRIDETHPAFAGRITTLTARSMGYHSTMVAGQAAANYQTETDANGFIYCLGIGPEANLLNQYTGDGTYSQNCRTTVTNAGPNGENGTIQNNSWGAGIHDPMNYQNTEADFDQFVRDSDSASPGNTPLIICFSSGNSGNSGLTRPKGAKNIITTGSFENYRPANLFGCGENDADNINERYVRTCADSGTGASSIGNCGDGRVKPDVVAPGQWTASANSSIGGKPPGHSRYISARCVYGGGTSAASPKTAGVSALIIQWWRQRHTVDAIEYTPSPALAKAMLINGAVDTGEGGPIPNEEQGWGRINLNNVFNPEMPVIYVDQNILLEPGSADIEFDLEPINTTQPMRITLVWTDVPGANPSGTAGNPALVNALGLEVTRGTNTWFGNNFAGGWSQTGGVQDAIQTANPGDIVNNVQNIFILNPTGVYHARISPESIVGDCLDPTTPYDIPADFRQDFALVIQNARLTTTEPLDVMLCIDRTGSMSADRIAAAIASGQEFFDLIPTGTNHRAGLVSYAVACHLPHETALDDKVTVDVDMGAVTDALKTTAQGLIGAMTANGCTSIGAGLTKAMQRIVDNGEPLHRKVIVLLSDGKENRPPYVSEILPRLRKEYRVHAVGLGGSINAALMQQIADDTHGQFLHTLDPDEVTPLYREIMALETDEEVVGHENGLIPAGEEEEEKGAQMKRFPIVNSDSRATFTVGWKNPDVSLDVELVTPKGEAITPAKAKYSSTISYVKRDTHVIYTMQRPARESDWEGEWSLRVRRASGSAEAAETYTASVLVRTSLRQILLWDKVKYFTKDLIRLKVQVIDKQYVLKNSVKMAVHTMTPVKGYGSTLASMPKKALLRPTEDAVEGSLSALDRLSEEEWQALYIKSEEASEISFKMVSEDGLELSATPIFTTPHVAKLSKRFRPLKDGIYTYRVKVEGRTASGARYTRVRSVSKYVGAKVDAKISTVVLKQVKPQEPKVMKLTFTPKDLHGNLVGPGHATSIKVDVKKGALKGSLEDLLDGSYSMEIKAAKRPEEMAVAVGMADVSIPVPVPVTFPPVVPTLPAPVAKLEGKVEQLRFDEKGNFQGFSLQTLSGSIDFPSISSRLSKILAEAMEKDLTVAITQDESTGEVTEVWFKTP